MERWKIINLFKVNNTDCFYDKQDAFSARAVRTLP